MGSKTKKPASKLFATGIVATRVPGFALIAEGVKTNASRTPAHTMASALIPKLVRALSKPGINKEAVFKGRTRNVYSYSVDLTNVENLVRVDAFGNRRIGRFIGDRFVLGKRD